MKKYNKSSKVQSAKSNNKRMKINIKKNNK